ncbi:unnamed protein product [Owenia fusiformis]|uniref:Uncharacterized protein n=1 Tax=Owenia fusiformis TaxID=6347 RepID=A0A8J1TRI2_OWEFU|nr:unnamed protein product [Owenia fusiformis]
MPGERESVTLSRRSSRSSSGLVYSGSKSTNHVPGTVGYAAEREKAKSLSGITIQDLRNKRLYFRARYPSQFHESYVSGYRVRGSGEHLPDVPICYKTPSKYVLQPRKLDCAHQKMHAVPIFTRRQRGQNIDVRDLRMPEFYGPFCKTKGRNAGKFFKKTAQADSSHEQWQNVRSTCSHQSVLDETNLTQPLSQGYTETVDWSNNNQANETLEYDGGHETEDHRDLYLDSVGSEISDTDKDPIDLDLQYM